MAEKRIRTKWNAKKYAPSVWEATADKEIKTEWNVKKYAPSIWDKEGYDLSTWDVEKRNPAKLIDPNKKKENK